MSGYCIQLERAEWTKWWTDGSDVQGTQLYMDDRRGKNECGCIKEVIMIKRMIKFVQFCDSEISFQSECNCTGS